MVAVGAMLERLGGSPEPEHIQALEMRLMERGYTRFEIMHAAHELSDDPQLARSMQFGHTVNAADFRRIIDQYARLRQQLKMKLREIDVNKLVIEFPRLLSVDDFGCCGYDEHDAPQYKFIKKGPMPGQPAPTPTLPDAPPPHRLTAQGKAECTRHPK